MAQSTSATDHLDNAIEVIKATKKDKSLSAYQKRAIEKIKSAKVFLSQPTKQK